MMSDCGFKAHSASEVSAVTDLPLCTSVTKTKAEVQVTGAVWLLFDLLIEAVKGSETKHCWCFYPAVFNLVGGESQHYIWGK